MKHHPHVIKPWFGAQTYFLPNCRLYPLGEFYSEGLAQLAISPNCIEYRTGGLYAGEAFFLLLITTGRAGTG